MSRTRATLAAILVLAAAGVFAQDLQTFSIGQEARVIASGGWTLSSSTANALELVLPSNRPRNERFFPKEANPKPESEGGGGEATMLVVTEPRRNHDEALRRLEEIAAERPEEVTRLLIGGWPAIERRYKAPLPLLGDEDFGADGALTLFTTTAVASGSTLVRFDAMLLPGADPKIADEALAMARTFQGAAIGRARTSQLELDRLRLKPEKAPATAIKPPAAEPRLNGEKGGEAGLPVNARAGLGELEVASPNGVNVVVATNTGFSISSNGGGTYANAGNTPCNQTVCDGDPSLAVGQSGAMFYAWLGGPSLSRIGDGISRSTNNGQTWTFRGMAVNCPGASNCQIADQEHIAADRFNAGTGGDRVYNVWRNFTPTALSSIRIVCSSDGGANWGNQLVIGAQDFPRVNVGRDGSVYVAWATGSNMMLSKFSPCDASNNLAPQVGFPVTVSTFTDVVCPVPGLDRCNRRNSLSSPVMAVDELEASHVYYAFATSTGAGNEDVILRHSSDGGATFPRSVRVNASVPGRRFMPWVSVYGGVAALSWYDRRNATPAQNDSTRFFIGMAKLNGPTLRALSETDLSGTSDRQCSTWPCPTDRTTDSESCSVQPQLAGICSSNGQPCDFSSGDCPGTCQIGRGCPKYGDYNGNAATAGRFFSAWASSVPPLGVISGPGINVFSSTDRIPSDFFVRDWTTNATTRDSGVQPSTSGVFWTSSDVWNQRNSTVLTPVNDFIIGHAPARFDSNFAFARVSRRAPAMPNAPPATVTVRFAYADFGAGLSFIDMGTENVTFAAGDVTRFTAGRAWSVPLNASRHLCLVAEIDGPDGDTLAPPSVVGLPPGVGAGLITADNNKAQRNLQNTTGMSNGAVEMFAIVRNDRSFRRPVRLRVTLADGLEGEVRVVGGKTSVIDKNPIEIGDLQPGEERWVQFRATVMPSPGKSATVDFADDIEGGGGFSIGVLSGAIDTVAQHHLEAFGDVMLRIYGLQSSEPAKAQAEHALELAKEPVPEEAYLSYLRDNLIAIGKIVDEHLRNAGSDPMEIAAALDALRTASDNGDASSAATAHNALTERLDAHLTMLTR